MSENASGKDAGYTLDSYERGAPAWSGRNAAQRTADAGHSIADHRDSRLIQLALSGLDV